VSILLCFAWEWAVHPAGSGIATASAVRLHLLFFLSSSNPGVAVLIHPPVEGRKPCPSEYWRRRQGR
jgi:hypothetical protein